MRVIGGRWRGRRLQAPRWPGLRPSSDRLRETLFNVLGARVDGARVLDLCAGTGAVGIEALSRGASAVTFVDHDARACRLIEANLAACGVSGGYTILRSTIEQARMPEAAFDVVFLDPPYDHPSLDRWVEIAAAHVAPNGLLVVEHARRRGVPARALALERTRDVRSGDSVLALYRASPQP